MLRVTLHSANKNWNAYNKRYDYFDAWIELLRYKDK